MLQKHTLLLVVAAAVGASAQTYSHSFTGSRSAIIHCTTVLQEELPKLTGAPEPDDDIEDLAAAWAAGAMANVDDNCELPGIGGPGASAFSAWASSYSSWRDSKLTVYQSIYSACTGVSAPQPIPTESGICSTFVAQITGGPGSGEGDNDDDDGSNGQGSGNSDDDDDDNNDGDGDNSSSQLSGMGIIGAAAAAGIVAAVVL